MESSAILLQLPRGQTHGGEGVGWGAGGCRGRTAGLGGLWAAPPGAVPGGGLRGPAPGGVGGCRCLLLQGGAEELAEGAGQEREEGRLPGFVLPGDPRSSQGAGPGRAGLPPCSPPFWSPFALGLHVALRCILDQLCFPPCKGNTGLPGTDEQESSLELRAETPRVLACGFSQLAPASTRGELEQRVGAAALGWARLGTARLGSAGLGWARRCRPPALRRSLSSAAAGLGPGLSLGRTFGATTWMTGASAAGG